MAIIALTTDFGQKDHYVASIKGVILQIDRSATIVDVTHEIGAQAVMEGAFVLRNVWSAFGVGTIHVAVVDPHVGTRRRILAAQYDGRIIIAPDNGLVSMIHRDFRLEALHVVSHAVLFAQPVSATFHGRDIMAPVAGHLSRGLALGEVGPATNRLEMLNLPAVVREGDAVTGQVIHVDHYGNLVTNISRNDLASRGVVVGDRQVWLGQRCVGLVRRSYADVAVGECVALIGSTEHVEVAINQGSAAQALGGGVGDVVQVR